jgi:hypothetical protein
MIPDNHLADTFLRGAYPAVIIDRWTAFSGWDQCYRVFLATTPDAPPTGDEVEHPTLTSAAAAARDLALRHSNCPIHDLTQDHD